MIRGDKIKLTKPMGAFTNIGEICEVIDVAEGGVISFRFGGHHLGCMSYDEYLKYFEPVITESEKPKREWTDWKTSWFYYTSFNGKLVCVQGLFRHNGKKVQIKSEEFDLKAEAACAPEDTFDLEKGLDLAKLRLAVKILNKEVKEIAKGM